MITVPDKIVLCEPFVLTFTEGEEADGVFVNAELWEEIREGHFEGLASGTGDHAAMALIDLLLDMDAEGVRLPEVGAGRLKGLAQSAIEMICASLTEATP